MKKKQLSLLTCSLLLFTLLSSFASAQWWNPSYQKCKDITVTNVPGSALSNFPAYIRVAYDSDMQNDYDDLRFVDQPCDNGGNQLPHEIESYDGSQAHVWVKFNSLPSGGDTISVYYDASVSSGENPTAVWDASYTSVWHMESSGSTIVDSTGSNSQSLPGTWQWQSGSKIGYGLRFTAQTQGSGNYRNSDTNENQDYTVELWVRGNGQPSSNGYSDQFIVHTGRWGGMTVGCFGDPPCAYVDYTSYNGKVDNTYREGSETNFGQSGFDHLVLVSDWNGGGSNGACPTGTEVRLWLYKNGVLDQQWDRCQNDWPGIVRLGTEHDIYQADASIDEFRTSQTLRSAAYVKETYELMQNQGSRVSFGSEESQVSCFCTPAGQVNDNECGQSTTHCETSLRQYGTRDPFGNCAADCGSCTPDPWSWDTNTNSGSDYCNNCAHCEDGDTNCGEACEGGANDAECPQPTNQCDTTNKQYGTRDSVGDCVSCSCSLDSFSWDSDTSPGSDYCQNCNHCYDGVLNCDETVVDHGGVDCPAGTTVDCYYNCNTNCGATGWERTNCEVDTNKMCDSSVCEVTGWNNDACSCDLTSISITPNCGADGCDTGETISINAVYTGNCAATIYAQVDAKSEDADCTFEQVGGDIQGIHTTCSSSGNCGDWTMPASIPAQCVGDVVNADIGAIWETDYPPSGDYKDSMAATGSFSIYDAASACASHDSALTCGLDTNCDWCSECDNNKYSGGPSQCVPTGGCSRNCIVGECNADCDELTDFNATDGTCDYNCDLATCTYQDTDDCSTGSLSCLDNPYNADPSCFFGESCDETGYTLPTEDTDKWCTPQSECRDTGWFNDNCPCILDSVTITPNCGADGCKESETISIDAQYSGNCPATVYIQVDADGTNCHVEYDPASSDISGVYGSCTSPGVCTAYSFPEIPSKCLGDTVTATDAALYINGFPGTGSWQDGATPTGSFTLWSGCPVGTTRCADGSCLSDCTSPPIPPGNPACNSDHTCDPGENCACEDCDTNQDSCEIGLVCSIATGQCSCPTGSTWCPAFGECRAACNSGGCNDNTICETGEGCDCQDCDGKQDGCLPGLICNFTSTLCEAPVCPDGTQNCDGVCKETCDAPVCNGNGICEVDLGESCGCHEDCENSTDPCVTGYMCTTGSDVCQLIRCPEGTTWCQLEEECKATCLDPLDEPCNLDGTCQYWLGESCICSDCLDEGDHCQLGLTCSPNDVCRVPAACPLGTDLCDDGTCSDNCPQIGKEWKGCIGAPDFVCNEPFEGCHCSDCSTTTVTDYQGPCMPDLVCDRNSNTQMLCALPKVRDCETYENDEDYIRHRKDEWYDIKKEYGQSWKHFYMTATDNHETNGETQSNDVPPFNNDYMDNLCNFDCIYYEETVVNVEEQDNVMWQKQFENGKFHACEPKDSDKAYCYSTRDCVFQNECKPYNTLKDVDDDGVLELCDAWNETSEICDNGADDDGDTFIDLDDSDCDGFLNIFVEVAGVPLEGVKLTAISSFATLTNTTEADGRGIIQVRGMTENTLLLSKDGYVPAMRTGLQPLPQETLSVNITMYPSAYECQADCTLNNICEPSCESTPGCHFFSSATTTLCQGKAKNHRIQYNSTHEVVCCEDGPTRKAPSVKPVVDIEADQIVTLRKLVVMQDGTLANMVITVYK